MHGLTFRLATSVALISLLASCATTRTTYAPDGRKAYTLNCSGLARGWDKCFSAAGNLCGEAGYDVIDRSDEDASMGSAGGSGRNYGASFAKTNERSMVVACKTK
ncbi:MAG: hypothetical protein ACRD3Q_15870 [Terriglobales bacterium]